MVDREQQIKSEHRQTKPKEKEDFELLIYAAAASNHAPHQSGKEQRRIKKEVFAKKFERFERTKSHFFGQTAARSQVSQGDPGVLRVPDNRRNRANEKTTEQPIQARPFEFLPQPRRERQHQK